MHSQRPSASDFRNAIFFFFFYWKIEKSYTLVKSQACSGKTNKNLQPIGSSGKLDRSIIASEIRGFPINPWNPSWAFTNKIQWFLTTFLWSCIQTSWKLWIFTREKNPRETNLCNVRYRIPVLSWNN